MCIICVSKSGVQQPTDTTLRAMFRRNPHGAGYMYARDGKVTIHKGFMNIEDFLSADDSGEVVGNENSCVAVALVVRVGGQANDSVVCDAAAAGQVERPHHPRLI